MRQLLTQEVQSVAGGVVYEFALKPGVEVVGMEAVLVGWDIESWYEPGVFVDKYFEVQTPIFEYYTIYDQTVTYVYS